MEWVWSWFIPIVGLLIIFANLYLNKKEGRGKNEMFIPYIGFINVRFWVSVGSILLVIFVFNR